MTHPVLRPPPAPPPIQPFIAGRWSPYAFDSRAVPAADLTAIFEAARWAPSSYNEQPWRYIVATREQPELHARVLSCLVEGNQVWAKHVPVLALGCFMKNLAKTGAPNRAAQHDLGIASAMLTIEATARGVVVHQMIGIVPEKAREVFKIPADAEALTGLAIGYVGDASKVGSDLAKRDESRKPRNEVSSFVFGDGWGSRGAL